MSANGETAGLQKSSADARWGGFDVLRCAAALGVVVLHASAPYLAHPMPGLTWPVFDAPSTLLDWTAWSIELSVMPLFLMLAGYFTPPLLARQGDRGFVRQRASRLLIPLAVAVCLILPADLYIWLAGWLVEGRISPRKLQSLVFDDGIDQGLWGLGHLWFLHYLFLYAVAWVLCRRLFHRIAGPDKSLSAPLSLVGLAALGWTTLVIAPEVVYGFQHAALPVPSKWIYSGTYFVGGLVLAAKQPRLDWVRNHRRMLLGIGLLATVAGVGLGFRLLEGSATTAQRTMACGAAVLAAWSVSLGSLGWAADWRRPSSRRLRYLAAASLWVYLVHHPIVALAHIPLKVFLPDVAPALKMMAAASVAICFALFSFEILIRRRPLAGWLGTPREFVKTRSFGEPVHVRSADPVVHHLGTIRIPVRF